MFRLRARCQHADDAVAFGSKLLVLHALHVPTPTLPRALAAQGRGRTDGRVYGLPSTALAEEGNRDTAIATQLRRQRSLVVLPADGWFCQSRVSPQAGGERMHFEWSSQNLEYPQCPAVLIT